MTLLKNHDCSWIESVRSVLKIFTESTDNSYIEEKDSMICWNHHRVAPEYGQGQVKELHSLLMDVYRHFDIQINNRKGFLEVKSIAEPKDLVIKIMRKLSMVEPLDFIFALGDEDRYEDVFTFLNNKKNYGSLCSPNATAITCTLKKRPIHAKYFIEDLERVLTSMNL